jgi:hypothetical protein
MNEKKNFSRVFWLLFVVNMAIRKYVFIEVIVAQNGFERAAL